MLANDFRTGLWTDAKYLSQSPLVKNRYRSKPAINFNYNRSIINLLILQYYEPRNIW